ncbi:acyl carrier protein [Streptomyces erythrochromogenes]|uniref:acyl carrier protein n=1 Tax=Streptomyces erythrochromogenes TaxID=285574 RepID=UPI0036AE69B3
MPEVRIHDRVSASTQLAWKVLFGEELLRAADEEMLSSLQENPESWGRLLLDAWTTFAAIGALGAPRPPVGRRPEEGPAQTTVTRIDPDDSSAGQPEALPGEVPSSAASGESKASRAGQSALRANTQREASVESTAPEASLEPAPIPVRPPAKPVDFFDPDEEDGPEPARRTASIEEVRARLVELVSEVSGYPPEVFEDHLDLEVDLGIDSIKQVETLGKVREEYGLPMDEDFVMRDYATIGKMADYIVARLATET